MPIGQRARGHERLHPLRRHDHVAQTQRRQQHFAKGADVDHTPGTIESLQGGQWTACVAILAVVIIFDHPRARARSPVQQREPTRPDEHGVRPQAELPLCDHRKLVAGLATGAGRKLLAADLKQQRRHRLLPGSGRSARPRARASGRGRCMPRAPSPRAHRAHRAG